MRKSQKFTGFYTKSLQISPESFNLLMIKRMKVKRDEEEPENLYRYMKEAKSTE
jgi:hypothetical protein